MKRSRIAALGVWCCLFSCALLAKGAPGSPVALVYSLTGEATLTLTEGRRPLRLFDRLPAGTTVEVEPGSRLSMAFANGRRYELGERSRATLGPADLSLRSGPVRSLPSVPPLPRLLPIAEEEQPGLRAGAVRIRAERIAGLYPRRRAATLAGATVLRFETADGAGKYRVEVQDLQGNVLFETETAALIVEIPAGMLKPGTRYHWTVRTIERIGPVARGEADFITLPSELAEQREALRRAVESAGDGASLALLAEVDRTLGLLAEARDTLRAAAQSSPEDSVLGAALAAVERDLAEDAEESDQGKTETGVVVEEVTPRSLGALAGLQAGDVLLSWCRAAADDHHCMAEGILASTFDLAEMETEQVPRGGVRVFGRRGGASATWNLLPGPLDIDIRPALPDFLKVLHREAQGLAASGDLDGAAEKWRAAAAAAEPAAKRKEGDRFAAWMLLSWGQALQKRAAPAEAERSFRRSLELYQRLGQAELAVAAIHHNLCELAIGRDLDAAEAACRQALTIVETAAPRSFALSAILNSLGNIALERGDLPAAERLFQRALDLDTEIASGSLASVLSLQMNAVAAGGRSDLVTAEDLLLRAKEIVTEAEPDGLRLAGVLSSLGAVTARRRDLEAAEDLFRRALEIYERLDPDGIGVPNTLYNLGALAGVRKDFEAAQHHFERALELSEKIAPEGSLVSDTLRSLALTAQHRGDISAARGFLQRALVIGEKVRPYSKQTADVLSGLGTLVPDDGDVTVAEGYFQRAVTILEKLGPAPNGLAVALYNLGRAKRLQRRFDSAAEVLCRAVDTIEIERGMLGGADTTAFGVTTADYYAACVGARIESGQQEEAFRVLERGRARAFLEQFSGRYDLAASELPAELVNRRKELGSDYDGTQSALSDLDPMRDKARTQELQARLREIRGLQDELAARIRRESPRYSSLHEPQTLDLAGARQALDPGTVLLSYAVDEEAAYLLVILPAEAREHGIAAFSLPVGEKDLRAAVAIFRNLLQNPGSDRRALTAQAQKLYDLLLLPAEHELAGAARLLVSPDGPLHILPFAALVRRGSYLTKWKPIHSVLSASVYAEIGRSRRPFQPAHLQLAAFGAPTYPRLSKKRDEVPADTLELFTAVSRGLSLDPLPSSQQEVEGIASLFPEARTFLGSEATEERVKAIAPQARLLHFACHGLFDESFPLNSALALTIPEKPVPGQDNGLLQAWEIFESLRLDADLVTLSACDSGLGKEMGSEGLIGLTRAFQFAGARSVLASLWGVSDLSTADLMKRFYGHLRAGKAKDEALQAAQVEMVRSPEFSHPYYWAAFQLFGDWK